MSDEWEQAALTWLSYALGDLEATRAERRYPVRPRIVAFSAQQSAEKALKAALLLCRIEPPRSHDLEAIRNQLPDGWRAKRRPASLVRLSDYAVEMRYPADMPQVTPIMAATAVRHARAVVRIVREDFERRGVSTGELAAR